MRYLVLLVSLVFPMEQVLAQPLPDQTDFKCNIPRAVGLQYEIQQRIPIAEIYPYRNMSAKELKSLILALSLQLSILEKENNSEK